MQKINKILIIRLSALGDTIHTLPLAAALRKEYPESQIDWVVEDKAEKFVVNNPLLNNVYVIERKNRKKSSALRGFKEFFKIINKIRHEKYDVVIDTQQLFKSAVIMGLSSGKRKIALDDGREFSYIFANEIIKTGRKQFDTNYHVVKRNLEIAKYLGCQNIEPEFIIPDFERDYSKYIIEAMDSLDKSKKTICVAPATTWDNKHWTVNGWADVINEFKNKYNIVITAAEKEKTLTEKIILNTGNTNILDLTGKTTLADLVYIYKNSDLLISPDSGSAHVAWCSGCEKIITLFFATSSKRTAPFGDNYYTVSSKTDCSPCMKKHCKRKNFLNQCTKEIKSEEIINIVKKVLQ